MSTYISRFDKERATAPTTKPLASLAALQWAADREGQSYGTFTLHLSSADEARIQEEYEAYKKARDAAAAERREARVGIECPLTDDIIEMDEPNIEDEEAEADELENDVPEEAAPEVVTTPALVVEPVAAEPEVPVDTESAAPSVDFATIIRSLPKEADPALYSRIQAQYGEETLPMVQAALKEATAKHRTTAAIRAFLAYLKSTEGESK